MLQKNWVVLQVKINKLTLRLRMLGCIVGCVLLIICWYFLIIHQQHQIIARIKAANQTTLAISKNFEMKVKDILDKSQVASVAELVDRQQILEDNLAQITKKIQGLQNKVVDAKALGMLLYDVLLKNTGVELVSFNNLEFNNRHIPILKVDNEVLQAHYYQLILKGGFLDIKRYLHNLEQLQWQLYWDSFTYEVEQYPVGLAKITFHTLSAE